MSNPASNSVLPPLMPPALVALIAFSFGIILDRTFNVPWLVSLLIAALALAGWPAIRWPGSIRIGFVLIACSSAGAFWHHGCWNWFPENDLLSYATARSTPICLVAKITGEGKYSNQTAQIFDARPVSSRTTYLIQPMSIRNDNRWESTSGKATLVIHDSKPGFGFGDKVLIYGKLVAVQPPTSPGQFDFQAFYRAKSIGANVHVYQKESILIQEKGSQFFASLLSRIRQRLNSDIWKYVGDEQAAFASAILLGNREQLSYEQRQQFVATGTAHLLAISGLHIGILASLFLVLYRMGILSRRSALWSTILFVLLYAWLVEFRPPATRAAILLVLLCGGRLSGRSGSELNLLAIAGLLILMLNPSDLFMLGPQLSFLAVASLIMFKQQIFPSLSNDPIDVLIRGTRPWWVRLTSGILRRCKQAVMVSGLIWLIGMPLVAANYHVVTPISLLVNPLVMIPIAAALFCGLAVCSFAVVCPPIAEVFGIVAAKSLDMVQTIVETAASADVGHWWTAGPLGPSLIVFYLAISGLSLLHPKRRIRLMLATVMFWVSLAWLLPFQLGQLAGKNSETVCTFIDVGHGSATWLKTQSGHNFLLDAGSMSSSRFAAQTISNVLWSNQVEHIDAVIISHADLDHFNAVPELCRRFSIGAVFMSQPMSASPHVAVTELNRQLKAENIPIRILSRGHVACIGNSQQFEVLLPPEAGTGGNDNANSLVLSYRIDDKTILFPGDLEGVGMHCLLQMPEMDCNVAAMPHHGSKYSRPEDFVGWCRPEHVVISASAKRTDRKVVSRIKEDVESVNSTGDVGTIQAKLGQDVRLSHWSRDGWTELKSR